LAPTAGKVIPSADLDIPRGKSWVKRAALSHTDTDRLDGFSGRLSIVDSQRALAGLVAAAERLGIEVRSTALRGTHPSAGGMCLVNGKRVVLLNSKASPIDRSLALAEALATLNLDLAMLEPEVARYLELRSRRRPQRPLTGPGLVSTAPARKRRRAVP
jgi:hypothetical protein